MLLLSSYNSITHHANYWQVKHLLGKLQVGKISHWPIEGAWYLGSFLLAEMQLPLKSVILYVRYRIFYIYVGPEMDFPA